GISGVGERSTGLATYGTLTAVKMLRLPTHWPEDPEFGRTILSLAQWKISDTLITLEARDNSAAGARSALKQWRRDWNVPRLVYLCRSDNRLLLDLDSPRHLDLLVEELRHQTADQSIVIQEAMALEEQAWIDGADGRYIAEFVVPLALREPGDWQTQRNGHGFRGSERIPESERLRAPGSEWVFAKLYCREYYHDDLVLEHLLPFAQHLVDSGIAHEWFYVRYKDPDAHIRLRLRSQTQCGVGTIMAEVSRWWQPLLESNICSRVSFDTYEREIERYGGMAGLREAERIFAVDSAATAKVLLLRRRSRTLPGLIPIAVLSVERFLHSLGLPISERMSWFEKYAMPAWHSTGQEYRREKDAILGLLTESSSESEAGDLGELTKILSDRDKQLHGPGSRLRSLSDRQELTNDLGAILRSLVHMHCNRLLGMDGNAEASVLALCFRSAVAMSRGARPKAMPLRSTLRQSDLDLSPC
ncbi:MAG TPA: thiopeptide-type bacteriocin biosynthesis protein, partial [Candidatus Obscuribacterales bacterium]